MAQVIQFLTAEKKQLLDDLETVKERILQDDGVAFAIALVFGDGSTSTMWSDSSENNHLLTASSSVLHYRLVKRAINDD